MNSLGHAAGICQTGQGPTQAFFWADANGNGACDPVEMIAIPAPGGTGNSVGAINGHDEVVGECGQGAFLWDPVLGTRMLNDLDADGLPDHPEWVMRKATGINDNHQVTGEGGYTDSTGVTRGRAFLLDMRDGTIVARSIASVVHPRASSSEMCTSNVCLLCSTRTRCFGFPSSSRPRTARPLA